jgi:hypothetical protein
MSQDISPTTSEQESESFVLFLSDYLIILLGHNLSTTTECHKADINKNTTTYTQTAMSQPESTTNTPSAMVTDSPLQTEDEYEQLKRFQVELEFVQCLSNPWYLHRTSTHTQTQSRFLFWLEDTEAYTL